MKGLLLNNFYVGHKKKQKWRFIYLEDELKGRLNSTSNSCCKHAIIFCSPVTRFYLNLFFLAGPIKITFCG